MRGPVARPTGPLATALHHLLVAAAGSVAARRRIDPGADSRVRITTGDDLLVVRDDGVGLSTPELRALLTASSSGAGLRTAPATADTARLRALVHAGLRVADEVEIRARSAEHPEAAALRAVIGADGTVRVSLGASPAVAPGTEVRLRLEGSHRAAGRLVPGLVADLADLVADPVELDGHLVRTAGPLDTLTPAERAAWCRERLGVEPLAVLPLGPGPYGTAAVAVVLPRRHGPDDRPEHRVHLCGLRVADAPADLLPEWAGSCQILLEAGSLPLTPDREALVDGAELDAVRDHLGHRLLAQLVRLEAYEPETFARVAAVHEAIVDDATSARRGALERVRAALPVPTSLGPMSLQDFVGVAGVVAAAGPDTWPSVAPVAGRAGVLVVDARDPGVLRLLETLGADGPAVARLRPADLTVFGVPPRDPR